MWREVGVRVGLPRHDMDVEGAVVKDDSVYEYGFVELRKSHTGESYQN